ncbi:hypothetical protein BC567DRAFT_225033 [Phyllosticta citribraziliensis]
MGAERRGGTSSRRLHARNLISRSLVAATAGPLVPGPAQSFRSGQVRSVRNRTATTGRRPDDCLSPSIPAKTPAPLPLTDMTGRLPPGRPSSALPDAHRHPPQTSMVLT